MRELFAGTKIGGIEVKNRFVRSATWENMATAEGELTPEIYDIYAALARGGVGLIITGYANVVAEEKPNPGMFGIYDDSFIENYRKLTDLVHLSGSKIVLQAAYGGTKTSYDLGERMIFAPSAVAERNTGVVGTAMTRADIRYIVAAFAAAARRAREGGFDGIEVHGAHTYLINQFLSPYYNRREDEYGGSLENRLRFLADICREIQREAGRDFPLWVKLTCCEFFDGGLTFAETLEICRRLQELGVSALEITGNIHSQAEQMIGQEFDGYKIQEQIYFRDYAAAAAEAVELPVIVVGGIKEYEPVEDLLQQSRIAGFGLSRPLLAEPGLIGRWQQGERVKVKCIRCSKCRTDRGNYCVVFAPRD